VSSTRLDVAFTGGGGTVLRGWLLLPDGVGSGEAAARPSVVMAHGFSAVKEMGLVRMAEALADAGFVVLAYDHRNLGASDGEPRQEIDIWAQARDYRHAITWLAARPEVDPARIAIWGSSFSGGEVLVVAAADRRVAAVVAQVPFAGVAAEVDDADGADWAAVRDALLGDVRGTPAPPAGPIAVVTDRDDEPAILGQPEAWRWFQAEGTHPDSTWRNECTLRNDGGPVFFDPGLAIAHVAPTPLLMIVATDDRLAPTDIALAAFARAGSPKELLVAEGDHFVVYDGDAFAACRDATIRFLEEFST